MARTVRVSLTTRPWISGRRTPLLIPSCSAYLPTTSERTASPCSPDGRSPGMTTRRRRASVVNQEFARRIFGSVTNAIGGYYKMRDREHPQDADRIHVVGVVEDGKYASLTEKPTPAMFLPLSQAR